ncbi:MAG: 3-deoxy-7-phosphoheptulonate synthase [Deltaproteobacteria bacterium]|nr:MAG: 3-deoxy-7-phosphoheptulonate synthase [Deltaproteobacteria bacterium]
MKTTERHEEPAALAPLPTPAEVAARFPASVRARETVAAARLAIRDLLAGRDRRRMLVVVGPCSLHDPAAAMDYACRLSRVADATRDQLVVVMRTYFEKPRTTTGWKGLINDPRVDGSCDVASGLMLARAILRDIGELGLACGSELLDPATGAYIGDLLSWAAIGARTSESQVHREMASGLPMPVGFKNATDGRIETAARAMIAAGRPHTFIGMGADGRAALVRSGGNPDRHLVLRGGDSGPNYSGEHISRAASMVAGEGIERPIMVDCSHGNSGKDPAKQAGVCRAVLEQARRGRREVLGVMLESNLREGSQPWAPREQLAYGVSITDACIGWEETEALLYEMAELVSGRPAAPVLTSSAAAPAAS